MEVIDSYRMEEDDGDTGAWGSWDEAVPACYAILATGAVEAEAEARALIAASNVVDSRAREASWLALPPTDVPTGLFPDVDCPNCPPALDEWMEGPESYYVDRISSTFSGGAPLVRNILNNSSTPEQLGFDYVPDPHDRIANNPPWRPKNQRYQLQSMWSKPW